ncbi:glycoside hydrolase family 3 N-terminal domain-containing protein [Pseudarthrobacter sp. NPDC058119]|uniref:glycoside hydrolase family 3 N-terminal domain-containing protein n=1 Tax=Pseudarthrobacter sp. NPDC058119 TaxID=3346348 RepID=UPI0036DC7C1C
MTTTTPPAYSSEDQPTKNQSRVDALIARMSREQKVAQLQGTIPFAGQLEHSLSGFPDGLGAALGFSAGASIPGDADYFEEIQSISSERSGMGIRALLHGEAVTGWTGMGGTVFPSAIGLGATWNPPTVQAMSDLIRRQMLAVGVRHALSPVMDVARDPRWGRVGETYGEDPTLAAAMSVAFVRGIQGADLRDGIAATGKHFLGYSSPMGGLNVTSNAITPRELREVYAKPFQAAISEAGLASIMNSYGSIDGELVTTSPHLLTGLLRGEMGFEGPVVSDYMSINLAVDLNLVTTPEDGGVKALQAGLDVELPIPYGFGQGLIKAIECGELDEAVLDRAVHRLLTLKHRLGLLDGAKARKETITEAFDPLSTRPYTLRSAREAIVLLKNDGILPLAKNIQKVAIIGPHGNSLRLFFGCYTAPAGIDLTLSGNLSEMAGMLDLPDMTNGAAATKQAPMFEGSKVRSEPPQVEAAIRAVLEGRTPTIVESVQAKLPDATIVWEQGCDIAGTRRTGFDAAITAATDADVVLLTLGGKYGWGSSCTSGEGIDTDDIGLPGVQEELAKRILETGTPAIFVHMDARPLSSEYVAEHFPAVIENWFPGETGGQALADVLFGDYNPAGRLPMTAARHAGQIPVYAAHRRSDSFSGTVLNRYFDGNKTPLFVFGHGLSYTSFEYSDLAVDSSVRSDGTVEISCSVTNSGSRDGDEVVQLYVRDEFASMVRPVQELAGFARVHLTAGQTRTVRFTVRADQFAFLDANMQWVVEAGDMGVRIGASSNDLRLKGSFRIEDNAVIDSARRGFYATVAVD